MDPKIVVDVLSAGADVLTAAAKPKIQYAEIQVVLTREETQLLNQLREGGPCVICGRKGAHVTEEVQICKFVNEVRSGSLFWKKNTHFFVRRSVVAPLCSRHYQEAKTEEKVGCMFVLAALLATVLFSCLSMMLMYKQVGPGGDPVAVILWFVVGFVLWFVAWFVVFAVLFVLIRLIFLRKLDGYAKFESIWECGPLKRLLELNWIKCGDNVGEKQLNESMAKTGEYVS